MLVVAVKFVKRREPSVDKLFGRSVFCFGKALKGGVVGIPVNCVPYLWWPVIALFGVLPEGFRIFDHSNAVGERACYEIGIGKEAGSTSWEVIG